MCGPTPTLSLLSLFWCHAMECLEMKPRYWSTTGSLTKKSGKSNYYETSNFIKSRMSIAIVRFKSRTSMHYASEDHACIPTMSRMSQHSQWGDGAGLSLFYHSVNNKHISKFIKR